MLFKSLIKIPSIGAFSATFFSASKVLDFLAINVESFEINIISIYGSSKSNSKSSAIRFDIIEL